jgi:hypothetical protein
MAGFLYEQEVQIVHRAIALLREEEDQSLIRDLETEQRAASTGLEWHGITSGVFQQILATSRITPATREALKAGVRAVRAIFGSEEA